MTAQTFAQFQEALSLAVPLKIRRFAHWPLDAVAERVAPYIPKLEAAAATLPAQAPVTAIPEWVALVETIAFLAFRPGGVTLFGLSWEAAHPDNAGETLALDLLAEAGR